MKYLNFRSRAEFYRTDLAPEFFDQQMAGLEETKWDKYSWGQIKPLILHKDCPERFVAQYVDSDLWYIRLTAMLNKHSWKKYARKAISDKKSTVRAAAYRRIMTNIDQSPIGKPELLEIMAKDTRTHNYFVMSEVLEWLGSVN